MILVFEEKLDDLRRIVVVDAPGSEQVRQGDEKGHSLGGCCLGIAPRRHELYRVGVLLVRIGETGIGIGVQTQTVPVHPAVVAPAHAVVVESMYINQGHLIRAVGRDRRRLRDGGK